MKHQYFGDVSDYKKYGVLRAVANGGEVRLLVCWMLTPSDMRTDGNNNSYLLKPNEWRHHEPDIFDFLHKSVVVNKVKDLGLVEKHQIVPSTAYFNDILLDKLPNREEYFQKLAKISNGYDLVFFDPDNGIATNSITKGRKNSSKYVFWDEIETFWAKGHSLLIYQHFPRVNRMAYINRLMEEIRNRLHVRNAYAIKTTFMVYFLLIKENHKSKFYKLEDRLGRKWGGALDILKLVDSKFEPVQYEGNQRSLL